jgi:lysophospholipase L1-like esterase
LFRWLDWKLRVEAKGVHARKVGWQLGGTDVRTGFRRVRVNDYAANLEAFCERMLARDGGVVFVQLANREDLRGGTSPMAWEPYRRVMAETAERYGALVVSVPAAFVASGRSVDALFMDQMHPTAGGHALMAEAIASALSAAGWPGRPLNLHAATAERPAYDDTFEGKGGTQNPTGGPRH